MIKKLKDICTLKVPKRVKYNTGNFYKILDVTALDTNRMVEIECKCTNNKINLLHKNDIVMVSFDYTGKGLGYTFFVDKNNEYVAGIDTIILTNCSVNPEALSIYLKRKILQQQIQSYAVTAITTSKRISPKDIENIEIDTELLQKCTKFTKICKNIDNYIKKELKYINESKKMYRFLERKIFEEVEKSKLVDINDICTFKAGSINKPKNITEDITSKNNIPVFSGSEKKFFYTDKSNTSKNCVLYSTLGGNLGNAFCLNHKTYAINKMIIIESKKIDLEFLAYQLNFFKPGIEGDNVRSFISLQNFSKTKIYVPSKAKQTKYVKYLNAINKDISNRNDEINNLVLLKNKIMNQGEI